MREEKEDGVPLGLMALDRGTLVKVNVVFLYELFERYVLQVCRFLQVREARRNGPQFLVNLRAPMSVPSISPQPNSIWNVRCLG
jgi:hypothetical protein